MSKKIEKLIKEDIDNNYSFEYNKEELYKQFVIKEKDNIIKSPKYKLILRYVIVLVIGIMLGSGALIAERKLSDNEIITKEFEEFVKENGHKINGPREKYFINIASKFNMHIYMFNSDDYKLPRKCYYFIIKSECELNNCYIILDERTSITKDSFGILAVFNEDDDQSIRFSIEIDGEIKEFVLN